MTASRPKTKGKDPAARRLNPRKVPSITRAEARRRAERHLWNQIFNDATVRDGATAKLRIYNWAGATEKDVWVVYKNSKEMAVKPSDVILVCKRTGRVLYEGLACDEG